MTDPHKKLKKQYHGVYHPIPALPEGKKGWKIHDASKTVVLYQGQDPDVARLIWNMGMHDLVPNGETMETMP